MAESLDKLLTRTIIKKTIKQGTMTYKKTRRDAVERIKKLAVELYKQGLTTREVGARIRYSHTFVANAVNEANQNEKKSNK